MGLLSQGTPLPFEQSQKYSSLVHHHGRIQLLQMFKSNQNRNNSPFLWGDEVEYFLLFFDNKDYNNRNASLSIDSDYILDELQNSDKTTQSLDVSFHPEYGRFMLEATPGNPYNGSVFSDFLYVEKNMISRRNIILDFLNNRNIPGYKNSNKDVYPLTLTSFPRLGCSNFTFPQSSNHLDKSTDAAKSLFVNNKVINRHPRFATLTKNIRNRRGSKVSINIPLFIDQHTNSSTIDQSITNRLIYFEDNEHLLGAAKPNHIYMDAMVFGMGCSCLQITMQAPNLSRSRYLYDSLAPLTPIMLSLSAAAPVFRGFLSNQDVRWNVISMAVDDRTPIERGVNPLDSNHKPSGGINGLQINNLIRIQKSRYDSIDQYLGGSPNFKSLYNDINSEKDSSTFNYLIQNGFDHQLSSHFAHLFIRDPISLFSEKIKQDDSIDTDHFENIQSTNWQTLRFKPPSTVTTEDDFSKSPGWRVEFRPMEIQITDFENAAYSVFMILVARAILKYKPNFYIPISSIDANMKLAHNVNSALNEKFYFRKDLTFENLTFDQMETTNGSKNINKQLLNGYVNQKTKETDSNGNGIHKANGNTINGNGICKANGIFKANGNGICKTNGNALNGNKNFSHIQQKYSVNEIVNGSKSFIGLIPFVKRFLNEEFAQEMNSKLEKDLANKERIFMYLLLIEKRASGEIPTIASYIRNFILTHKDYKKDSVVSETINYDLCMRAKSITQLDNEEILNGFFGLDITQFLLRSKI
ncbi:glutamate--cysteine ligase [Ascoidea rubescens DSM 1968]|uniref:Glutamate--cysteine ligase n=1 Tax=Ascoidea rubescens DSM 1968 TaxID=1344418 RepID=A0A1D2V8D6_9ASCO|nr:GCS-domain-containing protein [Ascoidea rubescens DSM 1968]ODV57912.1 GCS-domain-containing protein [Ascoidea rubescens DSM 1968]